MIQDKVYLNNKLCILMKKDKQKNEKYTNIWMINWPRIHTGNKLKILKLTNNQILVKL